MYFCLKTQLHFGTPTPTVYVPVCERSESEQPGGDHGRERLTSNRLDTGESNLEVQGLTKVPALALPAASSPTMRYQSAIRRGLSGRLKVAADSLRPSSLNTFTHTRENVRTRKVRNCVQGRLLLPRFVLSFLV